MGYAWLVLKADEPQEHHMSQEAIDLWNQRYSEYLYAMQDFEEGLTEHPPMHPDDYDDYDDISNEHVQSLSEAFNDDGAPAPVDNDELMRRLLNGEDLDDEEMARLQEASSIANEHLNERPPVRDDVLARLNRTPTPLSWFDPFRMTRPDFVDALHLIHEELDRRNNYPRGSRPAVNPDNPFVRHTRSEIIRAMVMINQELERRGRPPLGDEHFDGTHSIQIPTRELNNALNEISSLESFDRPRTTRSTNRVGVRSEPEPPRGDGQELMQMLLSGEVLTPDEIMVLLEHHENEGGDIL